MRTRHRRTIIEIHPNDIRRRRLLGAIAAGLALGAAAPAGALAAAAPVVRKPPRLRAGDTVALVAPGGYMEEEGLQKCVANLESLGLRVRPGRHLAARYGNYAGTVAQRLEDLNTAIADPDIKAVWAARGGQGCIALLPHIDYAALARAPKILVGYSDITALHLAIWRKARLVTFHGPVAWSSFTPYSVAHLRRTLMEPEATQVIGMADENRAKALLAPQYEARAVHHGIVEGRLMGGNLSLVAALTGTPYAADFDGAIAFIEEIGEAPHRIARMMAQLVLAEGGQSLRAADGLMLGIFEKCETKPGDVGLTLRETLDEQMAALAMPSAAGYSFGHIAHQFTLPVGVRARFDTYNQSLTLLEPAVL